MYRAHLQRFINRRNLAVVGFAGCLAWAAACGARDASPAGTPAHPEAAGDQANHAPAEAPAAAGAADSDLFALEMQAYERAKPVFEKYCAGCHTEQGQGEDREEALLHFSIDGYPFGGHHADEIGEEIREVLGAEGEEATMPPDNPGAVQGEELALVLAWADAFEKAQAARSGGDHHGHEEHTHHGPETRSFTIAPGKFAELNLRLGAGATASVSYEAGAALAWNIHSHAGGKTVVHREGNDRAGTLDFTAESEGGYSYLWHNKGTDQASLDVTLAPGAGVSVHSWHPEAE